MANISTRVSFFVAMAVAVVFIFGFSTVKETYRSWKVDQEIDGLQLQVKRLEQRKLQLSGLVQALQTEAAVDKQARQQLGMQKPGERVFVLGVDPTERPSWTQQDVFATTTAVAVGEARSNPEKWLRYFFVH